MYQALYRTWRPKTFSDVIGQEHITENLRRQVAEGRTSHAYLFTGTRGTGKTTCAKILAKAVNCEHPVDGDPCCQCPSCLGIEKGDFLDVWELDAASNNGVDQVRELRSKAIYSPAQVKKRVYIIDEVHMLTDAAFNALLKILEEPPEHLMFILATTELHKVLPTVLSRCQRYSFRRIPPQAIAQRLLYVAGQEHIQLTADGAELLSRLSDGALRDGLSLLDQCAASEGVVDSAAVLEVLGLAGNLQTARLMEHILNRDPQSALLLLDQLYSGGKDMGAVLSELSTLTRDLLLRKTAPEGGGALLSGGYDAAALDRLSRKAAGNRFLYIASTLQQAAAELYNSANRRTDTELCLLRLCDESLSGDLSALDARIQRLEDRLAARAQLAVSSPAEPPPPVHSRDEAPPLSERPGKAERTERTKKPPADGPRRVHDSLDEELPPLPEEPPPPPEEEDRKIYDVPEEPLPKASFMPEAPPPPEAPPSPREADRSIQDMPEEPLPKASPAPEPPPPKRPDSPPSGGKASAPPLQLEANWWRTLTDICKNRLPPMYSSFLTMCGGVFSDGLLTVYAPDEVTLGRLDNDRVRSILGEELEKLAAAPERILFQEGAPPSADPEENRKRLLQFGSQYENIHID
ncbi:DNA polymerase III subunit gamma/tau [uncultured Oscillibacter sp.]|uniref:DNA polymerase III subunit gamma/tau n=1 Tax=uncultured Oscillibacter sp. TaxID=876091 RepID=UPI0026172649|nr:DNA polymerase III subunit gamma/tau [uncultured Oscillibacter sp.]